MKIKVLPDTVINQIAAGEVVERPASVVRELVDNAVDAGATDVFVGIEGGGHSRIRVRDNGCGMTRDEAILAFERHATSKVTSLQDLMTISTMGFRGEALPSIASVSKVRLTTRAEGAEIGTKIVIRGGKLVGVESCAWSEGTEIEIEHLFFNTPARRKFLKSPRSELARIRTWLVHSSLTRPHVRYRLVSDGDEIVHLAPASSIEARAAQVFSSGLMPFFCDEGGVRVEGMVAHPGEAVTDTTGLVVLVNGRLVSDKVVTRAVREGFDSMLKDREFPVGYVVVQLSSEDVDVNVHPQKSEVRFRRPDQVFAVVRGAVLGAVRRIKTPLPSGQRDSGSIEVGVATVAPVALPTNVWGAVEREEAHRVFDAPQFVVSPSAERASDSFSQSGLVVRPEVQAVPSISFPSSGGTALKVQEPFFAAEGLPRYPANSEQSFRYSNLRYIGQLLQCYLLCEGSDSFVVVDMHAAHERINYNRIRTARAAHTLKVQSLLIPLEIKLPEEQVVVLLENSELLRELAFEIEAVSHDLIRVRGVPSVVSHLDCSALVKELAAESLAIAWRDRLEERIDHMAARLACHASVRAGDLLSREEVYALFSQLDEAELAGACPHGRPVVATFKRDQVERWFGRDR